MPAVRIVPVSAVGTVPRKVVQYKLNSNQGSWGATKKSMRDYKHPTKKGFTDLQVQLQLCLGQRNCVSAEQSS